MTASVLCVLRKIQNQVYHSGMPVLPVSPHWSQINWCHYMEVLRRVSVTFIKWAFPVPHQLCWANTWSAQAKGQGQHSMMEWAMCSQHCNRWSATQHLVQHGQDLLQAGSQGLQDFHGRKQTLWSSEELPVGSRKRAPRGVQRTSLRWDPIALVTTKNQLDLINLGAMNDDFIHRGGHEIWYGKAYYVKKQKTVRF